MLLALIKLTISYQGVEEHLVLVIDSKEVLAGYSETVEATTQRQAFKCLSVDIAEVDTLGKIKDIFVRSVLLAFCHNGIGCRSSHTLDGRKAETYLAMLVHTECTITLIDIRPQGLDIHRLALLHEFGNLGNLREAAGHQRSHVFGRIMCLEIGCLISYP